MGDDLEGKVEGVIGHKTVDLLTGKEVPRRVGIMYSATRIESVEMLKPSAPIPVEPGDTWGVLIRLGERGIAFALHQRDARELARLLLKADEEINVSANRWAREGK